MLGAAGTFLALTLMVSASGKCGIIRKCGPALVTGVHSVTVSRCHKEYSQYLQVYKTAIL